MLALGLSVNVRIHGVTVPPKVTVAPSAETSRAETAAPICPSAQTSRRPNGERPKGGAQSAPPKRRHPYVTDPITELNSVSNYAKKTGMEIIRQQEHSEWLEFGLFWPFLARTVFVLFELIGLFSDYLHYLDFLGYFAKYLI